MNTSSDIDSYKKYLSEFLSFKSISTDPSYNKEMQKTALWLSETFKKNGFKTKLWKEKTMNPVVFADLFVSTKKETILIYGHYDVQPAKKEDGWNSDPFSTKEASGRLYGRGVIDNKGQVLVHMINAFELIKKKALNYNVKFIIEGNEETGNPNLGKVIKKYKKDLKCDFVLISDGELTNNKPTIEVSLRGGFNCTLTFKTAKNNLHSGMWGGAVPNAAHEMSLFLSKLFTNDNKVAFSEFFDDVDPLTSAEEKNNKKLEKESGFLNKLAGVKSLLKSGKYDFFTTTGLMPTIQVTGLKSGYIDTGYSNIVPATSEVKLNFRTVASQDYKKVMKSFETFVSKNTPRFVEYKIEYDNPHDPVKLQTENKYLKLIESQLSKVYKTKVSRRNVGGAIPFVSDASAILKTSVVSVPLVNEDCNMHGANENFEIKYLKKALEFSETLLSTNSH